MFITFFIQHTILIIQWENILLKIIKMKSCIILFCLLAVVYIEGAALGISLQEHKDLLVAKGDAGKDILVAGKDLLVAKADDAKDVISSFFGNLLEATSLKFLAAQLIEWIAWLLVTPIFGQNFTHLPSIL